MADAGGNWDVFPIEEILENRIQNIEGPYKVPQLVSSQAGVRTGMPKFQIWVLSI